MAALRIRDKNDSCSCRFDLAKIAPMPPQGDSDACFESCMAQFLALALPSSSGINSQGIASPAMCEAFNGTSSSKDDGRFWPLYWCDIKYCGLQLESDGAKGQDPNVNKIINNCNGIGIDTIYDTGPPPQTFSCDTGKDGESTCDKSAAKDIPSSAQDGPKTTASPTHPTAAHPTSTSKATTDTHGSASAGATTTTSASGLSHPAKIALAVCSAIGLLTLVGIILVCLRRRKRRKTEFRSALLKSSLLGSRGYGGSEGGPGGYGGDGAYFACPSRNGGGVGGHSPTPLLSPSGSAMGGAGSINTDPPLTPPLRLRDRRLLLPSILLRPGTSRSSDVSPPLTPLTPAYSPTQHYNSNPASVSFFSPSPICSPTVSKLVPRQERTPTPQKMPIDSLPPLPPQIACALPSSSAGGTGSIVSRGSLNSANTTSTATYCPSSVTANSHTSLLRHEVTLSTMSATTILPATCSSPPGSPPRPPRPHDAPLQIPDLLSAAPAASSMSPPPPTFRGFSPPPLGGSGTLPSPPLPPLAVSVSVPTSSATSPTRVPTSPRAFQLSHGVGSGFQRQQQQQQPRSFSSPFSSSTVARSTAKKIADITPDPPRRHTNKMNGMDDRGSWGSWDGATNAPMTGFGGKTGNDASTSKGLGIVPEIGTARSCSSPVPLPLHVHGHDVHVPLPLSSPKSRQDSGGAETGVAARDDDTSGSEYDEYDYDGHGSYEHGHAGSSRQEDNRAGQGHGQGQGGQQTDARYFIGGAF